MRLTSWCRIRNADSGFEISSWSPTEMLAQREGRNSDGSFAALFKRKIYIGLSMKA